MTNSIRHQITQTITSLSNGDDQLGGDLYLKGAPIKSLPEDLKVSGDLY